MGEKVRSFLRLYLPYATVALICLLYILTSVINIEAGQKPVHQIISEGALAFLFGINLTMILSAMGLSSGEREECVQKARRRHEGEVELVAPHMEELDDWCAEQNRRNYKIQRTKLLSKVGLPYAQCFDPDGVAIPYLPDVRYEKGESIFRYLRRRRLERKRRIVHARCVDLHLKEISSGELTSEGGNPNDPYNLGRSKATYLNQETAKGVVSKIVVAVISGYYGATLVDKFLWGRFIWIVLQAGMFLAIAVVKMHASHEYMITEFRARLEKKALLLVKFRADRRVTPMAAAATASSAPPLQGSEVSDNVNEKTKGDHEHECIEKSGSV